jgi:2-iminobutanoate/2-iminopropanoate deaminase
MRIIASDEAPKAIGPYVQAVALDGLLYSSGQIALTPEGQFVGGDIETQADQVFRNLQAVLAEAGAGLSNVLKTTVFVIDLNDFGRLNAIYARWFGDHKPARSTVQVARLPLDALVEIEVVARVPSSR